jgi:murein DD-endopeptidase MepM/ murein hydrolase activator NlpD
MGKKGPFKDLVWGKLNSGKKNTTNRAISSNQRTSLMSQLRQNAIDTATPKNKPSGPQKAIVLRVDTESNKVPGTSWMKAWYKEILETDIPETIKIKARIPTLHAGIPAPEKYGCDGAKGKHQFWINMHPTYYASSQNIEKPECGDAVIVSIANGDPHSGGEILANVVTREADGGLKKGGSCPPSDAGGSAALDAKGGEGDAVGGEEVSNEDVNPFMFPEDCDWDCMLEIMTSITTLSQVAPGRNPDGSLNTIASPYNHKGVFISRASLLDPKMPQPMAALKRALWANLGYVVMECVEQYEGDARDRYAQKNVFMAYARMFQLGGVRVYVSGKPYPGKAAKFIDTVVDYATLSGAKGIVMEPTWGYLSPGDKDKYSRQAEYLTSAMMKAGREYHLQVGFTNPWLPSATYTIAELDGEETPVAIRYKDSFPYACFSKVDWSICQILSTNGKSDVYVNDSTGEVFLRSVRGQNALKATDFVTALEDYVKMGFKNIIPAFGLMGNGFEDYRVSSEKPPGRVREELEFLAPKGVASYIGELATEENPPSYKQPPGFETQGETVDDWGSGYFGLKWFCEEGDPDPRCECEGWDPTLIDAPCNGLSLEEAVDLGGKAADLVADLTGDELMEDIADGFGVAAEVIDEVKDVTSQAFPREEPFDPPIKSQIRYSMTWWDWLNAEEHTPCWKSARWDIIKNFNRFSPIALDAAQEGDALANLSYETFGKQIQEAIERIESWNRVADKNPAMQTISLEAYMMAIQTAPSMVNAFSGMGDIADAGKAASHVAQAAATELGYDSAGSGASDVDDAIDEYSDGSSDIPDPDAFYGSDPVEETDTSGTASGETETDPAAEGGGATDGAAGSLDSYPAFGYINFDGGRNPNDQGGWYPADSGNFTTGNRTPANITHFVIHTTAGNRQTAGGDEFVKVGKKASTHYGINQGGWVFQFVKEKDTAWGQGVKGGTRRGDSWGLTAQDKTVGVGSLNGGGLSVEISGIPENDALSPGVIYNDAVYENLAFLIANCCHRNQIPVDRTHIFGHDELVNSRSDPGTKLQGAHPDGISYPLNSTPKGGDMVPGKGHQINSFGVNIQGNETFDWTRLMGLIKGYMTSSGVPMPPAQTWDTQGMNAAGASAPGGSGGGAAAAAGAPEQCGGAAGVPGAAGAAGGGGAPMTAAQVAALGDIAQNGSWPIAGTPSITSDYGPRARCWDTGAMQNHNGIDVVSSNPATHGGPLLAGAPGTVTLATNNCNDTSNGGSCNGGAGNMVKIDHGGGRESIYMHLLSSAVSVGATVTKGQVIGQADNTGGSFGAHLHFEFKVNGVKVNPMEALGLECTGNKCAPGNQNAQSC